MHGAPSCLAALMGGGLRSWMAEVILLHAGGVGAVFKGAPEQTATSLAVQHQDLPIAPQSRHANEP